MHDAPTTTNDQTGAEDRTTDSEIGLPALQFDPAEYREFLESCDWTDEQKDEFTAALWQIVLNFVDLGFGLHPSQGLTNLPLADSPSVLRLEPHSTLPENEQDARGHTQLVEEMDS